MSFPLALPGRTLDAAPDLARAVLDDANAGGGTVFPGERPHVWLARLTAEGRLDHKLVIGLCAALVRSGRPAGVAEAARLTQALDLHELAPLLPAALDGLDVGVLLTTDDADTERSVEDVLLGAWAAVLRAPGGDPAAAAARDNLLVRLRNAGLRGLELAVIARAGDAATLRALLPAILVEELAAGDVAALGQALIRESDVAEALADHAWALTTSQRLAVWREAVARAPAIAADRFGSDGERFLGAAPPAAPHPADDDEG